ncbi:MAG: DUF892 family protein [Gemmatimonadetes bacterium]|nr:DUF892 family protein [Gemmatimonadota bacterium]
MHSLHDLLVHDLQHLYCAEQQLVSALTTMAAATASPRLATAFKDHFRQSPRHLSRLEECFALLGTAPGSCPCATVGGLLADVQAMTVRPGTGVVRDAGLVGSAQRVGHYTMAAYRTGVALADALGQDGVAALLRETVSEEEAVSRRFATIVTDDIHPAALQSTQVLATG